MGQAQTKRNMKIKNDRRPKFESREEYFVKNGGILLQKQIALSPGHHKGAGQLKIYSSKDIAIATDHFNPDLIIDSNARSTLYKGILEDRVVVVKAPVQVQPNLELLDYILTEASIIMVMNHDNMVKLYGVCLETYIPILVYDFFPNGGFFKRLHGDGGSCKCIGWTGGGFFKRLHGDGGSCKCIGWTDSLRVASDAAYALAYMHNALSKPVVHRDFNSSAILLDCSFGAKLANFGYSVSITPGQDPQQWPVEGTLGYIDPEYIFTHEVTDKCDVYSFGVFMLELLTRKQPLVLARHGKDLVNKFVSAVEKDCMMEMIDDLVMEQAGRDEIHRVAQLALACVAKKGDERPKMIDVVGELWKIQGRDID